MQSKLKKSSPYRLLFSACLLILVNTAGWAQSTPSQGLRPGHWLGLSEIMADLNQQQKQNLKIETLGWSRQGRVIPIISLGNPTAQHQILWVCGQHGDEPDSVQACAYLMQDILKLVATDPVWQARFKNARWHLVPALNPDGLLAKTRKNAAGVNLNSNWSYGWSTPLHPSRTEEVLTPSGSNFHGNSPLSEPETQALAAWIIKHQPQLVFDYHTGVAGFSQGMVLFPFTKDLENSLSQSQYQQLKSMAQTQAQLLTDPQSQRDPVMAFQSQEILAYLRPAIQKHVPVAYHKQALSQLPTVMQSTGSLIDWSYGSQQIPALAFEISFPLDIKKPEAIMAFNQVYQDFGPALEKALAQALSP